MEVKFEFSLKDFLSESRVQKIPKTKQNAALRQLKDFILTEVTERMSNGLSPVTGKKFKKLSKDYLEKKVSEGGAPEANLELQGDLKDSLRVYQRGETLVLTVLSKEQPKADGHNNFSGKSKIPERKFIPNRAQNESFSSSFKREIKEFLNTELYEPET